MKNFILPGLILLLFAGCSDTKPKEITEVRKLETETVQLQENPPSAPPPTMFSGDPGNRRFLWKLPEGWQEKPSSPMRAANFILEDSPTVECYITVLKGTGGGVAANINRWQRQMGQPALTADALDALPALQMLGQSATYVEIAGNYQGMTGAAQEDSMMLAVVCPLADETVFVKMTGSAAAVQKEIEKFKAFCTTLRQESASTS